MQIAICDESNEDNEILEEFLKRYFAEKSITFDIMTFLRTSDLMYEIEDGKNFDIIFIENLPHNPSGINTAKLLRSSSYSGQIIFSAQTDEYAVDGYDVNACGYIIRPLRMAKLSEIMDRATHNYSDNFYCIRHRGDIIALPLNDIFFIESNNTKCIIHSKSGDKYTVYNQLRKIADELNDSRFLRCHQSYIVNMNHICKADKCFELTSGEKVLIRQRSLKEIRQIYLEYIDKTR